ncbi:MAG: hypothetical protein R2818_11465 [Flavobacteriales bacterium]
MLLRTDESAAVQANDSIYGEVWRMVDQSTRGRHHKLVAGAPFCDLSVFNTLLDRMPGDSDVHLANSTPARYAQLFRPRSWAALVPAIARNRRHR